MRPWWRRVSPSTRLEALRLIEKQPVIRGTREDESSHGVSDRSGSTASRLRVRVSLEHCSEGATE